MKPTASKAPAAQIVASLNKSERRASLRLLKHWEDARGAASVPKLADFDLAILEELGDSCFLLVVGAEDPQPGFRYFGRDLAGQIGSDLTGRGIADVPGSTLLSRVLGHYVEARQRRMPVGVHGRFEAASGRTLLYRGILLPFCSDGGEVTAVLGCYRSRAPIRASQAKPGQDEPAAAPLTLSPEQMLAGYRSGKLQAILRLAHKVAWPARVLSTARAAAPLGKATLTARQAQSEFVLLLARRVDPELNRFEVVSTAGPLLLNLAMRRAASRLGRAAEPDLDPPA
jgi:hypothetical protein